MLKDTYDVIVVGAGPGGSTAAAFLGKMGHDVLLIDKAEFPRDKTCGDAISGSLMALESLGLTEDVKKSPHSDVHGITFSAPNGKVLDIPFSRSGFVCRRMIYDNLIFQKGKEHAEALQGFTVSDLIVEDGFVKGVRGKTKDGEEKEFRSKIVVGADGAHSVVARKTGLIDHDPKHTITSVRCYYRGIKGMKDYMELHFVDDIIPGYFWIFPLEDDLCNVGIGMVNKNFSTKKWKMTDKMFEVIANNPLFKERFKDAKLEEGSVKGWTLPVGSKRRKAHGNGFMLIGDAAGLIDAFTGEGISNSMKSGEIASQWADKAIKENNFSEKFLKGYENEVWDGRIGEKLKTSYKLQQLGKIRFLTNLVITKATKSKQVRDTLSSVADNSEARGDLANPLFYLKLLLA